VGRRLAAHIDSEVLPRLDRNEGRA
jgi:hypothetical protein